MANGDWGTDQRRVRPLPPDADEVAPSESSSPSWLVYTVLGLTLVLAVGWLFWPDPAPPPRRVAAAETTTTTEPITATSEPELAPTPSATTPPPVPAAPVRASTEFGDMTWQIVAPTGSAAARWVTNPVWTGEEFVYMAGTDRLNLNRSEDGLAWDSARTDFDTGNAEQLELIATDGGLVMTGFGFGRPAVWTSRDGTRWREVDLGGPRPPQAGPIGVQWDWTLHGAAWPGRGAVLWTGAWFGIRWDEVLDREVHGLRLDADTGQVVVTFGPSDPGTAYEATVTAQDGAVHLVVRAAETGAVVHDSVSAIGGFDVDLAATVVQGNLTTQVWRPLGWVVDDAGAATLLQPDIGGFPIGNTWFSAADDGLVTGSSTFVSARPQPQTFVARSEEGRDWEVLPGGAFPAEAWIAGAVSDTDVVVLAGSMWRTVQLADQISARSQVGVALRTDDGRDWEVHETGFPPGAFELGGFGAGPLGFAAVNFQCPAGCSYQAFLSTDGRTWSQTMLPTPGLGTFPISGLALSTDRVVVIGAAEDSFGVLSNVRAWVGTVDD